MIEDIEEYTNILLKCFEGDRSSYNKVHYTYTHQKLLIEEKDKEIERLHSIIKEVREYIKKLKNFKIKYVMFEEKEVYASENDFVKELLEILDKENK